jgi:hypothetical protein
MFGSLLSVISIPCHVMSCMSLASYQSLELLSLDHVPSRAVFYQILVSEPASEKVFLCPGMHPRRSPATSSNGI